jgi:hypothetical protein
MLKQIEEVRNLWEGKALQLKNGLQQDITIKIFPKPVQHSLPVWVTVSGKKETFIDAGRIGANILTHLLWQDPSELIEKIDAYKESLRNNGFDPDNHIVSVMLHTFVGRSDEDVKKQVEKPLKAYIRSSVHLIEAMSRSTVRSDQSNQQGGRYGTFEGDIPPHLLDELVDIAFERFFENAALLGSPEKCHSLLKRLNSYGITELACLIDFGLPGDIILEGLSHLNDLKGKYEIRAADKCTVRFLRGNTIPKTLHSELSEPALQNRIKILVTAGREEMGESAQKAVALQYSIEKRDETSLTCTLESDEKQSPNSHYATEFLTPVNEDF